MNKKKGYLIDELEINSKFKNIRDLCRDIIDFKKGYQPTPNMVKEERGNLVADSHSILARWKNNFSQLFIVHGVTSVRQTGIHTAEPQVPEPSACEVEMKVKNIRDLCRDIIDFKKVYEPRTNIVNKEKGDLVTN